MEKQLYSGWTFWSDDFHHLENLDRAKFNFSFPIVHADSRAEQCIFKWHTYYQENSHLTLAAQDTKKEGKKAQSKNASRPKLSDHRVIFLNMAVLLSLFQSTDYGWHRRDLLREWTEVSARAQIQLHHKPCKRVRVGFFCRNISCGVGV